MSVKNTKKALLPGLFALGLCVVPPAYAGCGPESLIGSICITAATFCPRNYIEANGQLLPISNYTALFSLVGTLYGGNGTVNFAVPDLRGRLPVHAGQGPGLAPVKQGQMGGAETTTMTAQTLPSHSHAATTTVTLQGRNGDAADQNDPNGHILADPSVGFSNDRDIYSTLAPNADLAAAAATADTTVANTGGGQPIPVRNPYLGMRYCMATQGIFPSRP